MPSASWLNGWVTGDVVTAAEYKKSSGCVFDTTLGVASASIDTGAIIPTSYAHLRIECYLRGTTAATSVSWLGRFNADSGANYDGQALTGSAATPTSSEAFAQTSFGLGSMPANSAPANVMGSLIIDIPNYANTANNKVASIQSIDKRGTTTGLLFARLEAAYWRSNAAISRFTVTPSAGNWDIGSRVSVYVWGS